MAEQKYEVSFNGDEIYLPEKVVELFDHVRMLNGMIKNLKDEKDAIEKPLKSAMLKHHVDKFKCKYMSASTIKGAPYDAFNVEAMKADGVYDKYVIHMTKDDYVRINYKKEDKDE